MRKAAEDLESLIERNKRTYVKNNLIVTFIIIILSAIALIAGYRLGGITGLWIGLGIAILTLLISPLKEKTIEKTEDEQ